MRTWLNPKITCPNCGFSYHPYGAFMIEKCYCPNCGYAFHVIRGVWIIRVLYSIATFTALLLAYSMIHPQTSVVILLFWLVGLLVLKLGTYLMHMVLLLSWTIIQVLFRWIERRWKKS